MNYTLITLFMYTWNLLIFYGLGAYNLQKKGMYIYVFESKQPLVSFREMMHSILEFYHYVPSWGSYLYHPQCHPHRVAGPEFSGFLRDHGV